MNIQQRQHQRQQLLGFQNQHQPTFQVPSTKPTTTTSSWNQNNDQTTPIHSRRFHPAGSSPAPAPVSPMEEQQQQEQQRSSAPSKQQQRDGHNCVEDYSSTCSSSDSEDDDEISEYTPDFPPEEDENGQPIIETHHHRHHHKHSNTPCKNLEGLQIRCVSNHDMLDDDDVSSVSSDDYSSSSSDVDDDFSLLPDDGCSISPEVFQQDPVGVSKTTAKTPTAPAAAASTNGSESHAAPAASMMLASSWTKQQQQGLQNHSSHQHQWHQSFISMGTIDYLGDDTTNHNDSIMEMELSRNFDKIWLPPPPTNNNNTTMVTMLSSSPSIRSSLKRAAS